MSRRMDDSETLKVFARKTVDALPSASKILAISCILSKCFMDKMCHSQEGSSTTKLPIRVPIPLSTTVDSKASKI